MASHGHKKEHPTAPGTDNQQQPKTGWTPPRGMRLFDRPDRPNYPYVLQWRVDGERKAKAFETAKARLKFAKELAGLAMEVGLEAYRLNADETRAWRAFVAQIGPTPLDDVLACWLRHGRARERDLTVAAAVGRFLAIRDKEKLSRDSVSHARLQLARFQTEFQNQRLCDITTNNIRDWLAGLIDPANGLPFSPYTVVHHARTLKLFFKTAVAEGWTAENPAARIKSAAVESDEIATLSVADTMKLFEANRGALCIGRLALEAFGGLRFTSAARLSRNDLAIEEKGVVMPGHKHKSGKRHYVDGYPDNLWAWIRHAPDACWDIHPRMYLDLKAEAFARAGVTNPGNVLRHSFCTYHVAMHKDAARTAVLLTHRGTAMLYSRYKGRATEADGNAYFKIMPPQ